MNVREQQGADSGQGVLASQETAIAAVAERAATNAVAATVFIVTRCWICELRTKVMLSSRKNVDVETEKEEDSTSDESECGR